MRRLARVLKEEVWSWFQWCFLFIPGRVGHFLRGRLLSQFFKASGGKITIKENVEIYHPGNLVVGAGVGFGRNNVIDCVGGVNIGAGTRLGPNVVISTMHHHGEGLAINAQFKRFEPVEVGEGCWIGAGVKLVPGAVVGNNVIIAAGTVVTKAFESDVIIGGIPAKVIKDL